MATGAGWVFRFCLGRLGFLVVSGGGLSTLHLTVDKQNSPFPPFPNQSPNIGARPPSIKVLNKDTHLLRGNRLYFFPPPVKI